MALRFEQIKSVHHHVVSQTVNQGFTVTVNQGFTVSHKIKKSYVKQRRRPQGAAWQEPIQAGKDEVKRMFRISWVSFSPTT